MNNTQEKLNKLLQLRNEYPEKKEEIDKQIYEDFCQTHAILVLDMSGFSRTTFRYGIIHFLAMIHQMKNLVIPVIESTGGKIIKQEADNLFAVFPNVNKALDCSLQLQQITSSVNTILPEEKDIHLCIGIGYGKVLMIENHDMYGSEFNLAAKLGEDLAQRNEILLTQEAYQNLNPKEGEWQELEFSVSGLEFIAYKPKETQSR